MEGHTERRALCTLAGRELLPTMTSDRVGAAACVRRRSHEEVPIMGRPLETARRRSSRRSRAHITGRQPTEVWRKVRVGTVSRTILRLAYDPVVKGRRSTTSELRENRLTVIRVASARTTCAMSVASIVDAPLPRAPQDGGRCARRRSDGAADDHIAPLAHSARSATRMGTCCQLSTRHGILPHCPLGCSQAAVGTCFRVSVR